MRRTLLSVLWLTLVVWTSSACESRVSIGGRCTNDDECGELSCRFGRCRAECTRASECSGRGAVCVGEPGLGVCTIPSVDTCAGGCEAGLVCADEACSTACETSAECLSGARCEATSGACVAVGEIADAGADASQTDASQTDASQPDAGAPVAARLRTLCVGSAHACATRGGTVFCWGSNHANQLGDGTDDATSRVHGPCPGGSGSDCSMTPVAVQTAAGDLTNVIDLACAESSTCALRDDGRVLCWGSSGDATLGVSGRLGHIAVEVPGLSDVDHLSAGRFHVCARIGAQYRCWGHNGTSDGGAGWIVDDRLGTNETTLDTAYEPVDAPAFAGAMDLALGGFYTCALFAHGVECRGKNEGGITGDVTTFGADPMGGLIADTAGATEIGSGVLHGCVLVDGTPRCWGGGDHGELGPTVPSCVDALPGRCSGTPIEVPDPRSRRYTFLSRGYAEGSCAITDGEESVVCWGTNLEGSSGRPVGVTNPDTLGDDGVIHTGSVLRTMVEVARGAETSCARDRAGSVFCWGANGHGQRGCDVTPAHSACPALLP